MPPPPRPALIGLAVLCAVLAGCGKPPELRYPDGVARSGAVSDPPIAAPSAYYPSPTLPAYTPPTVAPRSPSPTPAKSTGPPPAPRCGATPSAAQVLAAVAKSPALPAGTTLRVSDGPYCAGGWQYTVIAAGTGPTPERLVAVTRGEPAALAVVEVGSDVCSDTVGSDAPSGIRTLACGP